MTTALLLKELDCTSIDKLIRDGNRECLRAHRYIHRTQCVKHIVYFHANSKLDQLYPTELKTRDEAPGQ